MLMTGYTKLFGSIVASTIWREPHTVRIVWITMLAMANKDGIVEASLPGLADLSRVTLPECKEALQHLHAPDEYSRTPDFQGRRIELVDGGWKILNHAKYRSKMGKDERREYLRVKQSECRARVKASTNVNNRSSASTQSSQAETDAEAQSNADSDPLKESGASRAPKTVPSGYVVPDCFEGIEGFTAALAGWIESRNKMRKPPTGRAIQLLIDRLSERPTEAVAALNLAVESGWQSVKWEWVDNSKSRNGRNGAPPVETYRVNQDKVPVWTPAEDVE